MGAHHLGGAGHADAHLAVEGSLDACLDDRIQDGLTLLDLQLSRYPIESCVLHLERVYCLNR